MILVTLRLKYICICGEKSGSLKKTTKRVGRVTLCNGSRNAVGVGKSLDACSCVCMCACVRVCVCANVRAGERIKINIYRQVRLKKCALIKENAPNSGQLRIVAKQKIRPEFK